MWSRTSVLRSQESCILHHGCTSCAIAKPPMPAWNGCPCWASRLRATGVTGKGQRLPARPLQCHRSPDCLSPTGEGRTEFSSFAPPAPTQGPAHVWRQLQSILHNPGPKKAPQSCSSVPRCEAPAQVTAAPLGENTFRCACDQVFPGCSTTHSMSMALSQSTRILTPHPTAQQL